MPKNIVINENLFFEISKRFVKEGGWAKLKPPCKAMYVVAALLPRRNCVGTYNLEYLSALSGYSKGKVIEGIRKLEAYLPHDFRIERNIRNPHNPKQALTSFWLRQTPGRGTGRVVLNGALLRSWGTLKPTAQALYVPLRYLGRLDPEDDVADFGWEHNGMRYSMRTYDALGIEETINLSEACRLAGIDRSSFPDAFNSLQRAGLAERDEGREIIKVYLVPQVDVIDNHLGKTALTQLGKTETTELFA